MTSTNLPHYIIGTRGSLLALTQCLQMKDQLEASGKATFSLKIIKTEGDENTSAPLWAIDGKDFFTKELDHALLSKEVDLVVHSYKDLGSERPEGIKLATITKRSFAHDILFIRKDVLKELREKKRLHFTVGTSSPRRMTNITSTLAAYLPWGEEKKIEVTTKNLRGNVNTRLKKCVDGEFDAVVLALPGIERLAMGLKDDNNEAYAKHGNPQVILKDLIQHLDFMVLPLSSFPAAASQGALAIECLSTRDDDGALEKLLDSHNDQKTINEVKRERELFQTFGGGCHLAVGINVSTSQAGLRQSLKGQVDERKIEEQSLVREIDLPKITGPKFIGLPSVNSFTEALADEVFTKETLHSFRDDLLALKGQDLLVSSPKVAEIIAETFNKEELRSLQEGNSWWASGTKTMRTLAALGFWVKGCADSLGEDDLTDLRNSHLITMFLGSSQWKTLTNDQSESLLGPTVAVYQKKEEKASPEFEDKLGQCTLYYWTSASQYEHYNQKFKLNPKAIHSCGLGKTYKKLTELGLEVTPISSMSELKNWIN